MHALHGGVGAAPRHELIGWRYQYLTGAGLDPVLAASVADDLRWDLHALLELLERGCPPGLATRILAPADDDEVRRG
ncbi:MAG: hypothetical protein M3P46_05645 [Actinomycetota bacterium]|nr:hypothetical protein [Actinomycetota bacterium]